MLGCGGLVVAIALTVPVAALSLIMAPAPPVSAQEAPPMMSVDFIVAASGYIAGEPPRPESLCVMLPDEASSVTLARRAFLPETGTDRPLTMSITPFVSTAHPLVLERELRDTVTLALPQLGGETCFTFRNELAPGQGVGPQLYKRYAQIVTIQVR
jgi:hypothetical protein